MDSVRRGLQLHTELRGRAIRRDTKAAGRKVKTYTPRVSSIRITAVPNQPGAAALDLACPVPDRRCRAAPEFRRERGGRRLASYGWSETTTPGSPDSSKHTSSAPP